MKARWLLIGLLLSSRAAADPSLAPPFAHLHSPRLACLGTLETPTDCIELSTGYFMDEPTYSKLDVEMKRLQDAETRLKAENMSLKQSAAGWQPGPLTLATAFLAGVALGVYVDRKI